MSKHVMVGVDGDDGGTVQCLGCRQYVYGSLTETPPGECPTPYKSTARLLAESVAREAVLREELAKVDQTLMTRSLRMRAAEQRNAELESLVTEAHAWVDQNNFGGCDAYELRDRLAAALKPTESGGASQCSAA